jgi:hypothetical protein
MAIWLSFQMLWLRFDVQHGLGVLTFVESHCLHRGRVDILRTYAGQEVVLNLWKENVGLSNKCSQAKCCLFVDILDPCL